MTYPEPPIPTLTLERWELRVADGGAPLRGDLRVPTGTEPETAVILCHGFKGFKDWGFFPPLARALAEQGHAAVSFNFSGSGVGADGIDFSALDRFAESTHSRNVAEIQQVLDAVCSGKLLAKRLRAIGLFGHSRGGGEAILAAAQELRVDALVTWAAIASVERWSEAQVGAWRRGETVYVANARTGQEMPLHPTLWQDIEQNRERLDIIRAAARVGVPWLIVHGEQDESVSSDDAYLLHRAATGPTELLLVAGAGHAFGVVHPFREPTAELRAVIDATLRWFGTHLAL